MLATVTLRALDGSGGSHGESDGRAGFSYVGRAYRDSAVSTCVDFGHIQSEADSAVGDVSARGASHPPPADDLTPAGTAGRSGLGTTQPTLNDWKPTLRELRE